MSKNYAAIYASPNDSIALNQRFYVKTETAAGTLIGPQNADFIYTLPGGSISFSQPFETSPHRSGRHNLSIIKKKKENTFSLKTYFNIDTSLGSASVNSIEPGMRVLYTSLLGNQDVSGGYNVYSSVLPPSSTFSLYEVGDLWARQSRACFMNDGSLQFPGDGEAMTEWTGAGKDSLYAGIAKCTTTISLTNIFTGQTGDGEQFTVGALVMIIKADGSTRSTDTGISPASYRTITAINGDDISLSGAALTTDSDGTAMAPSYLVYAEPPAPVGINQPQTGLVGTAQFTGLSSTQGIRQVTMKLSNNHEMVNYVYGTDSLATPFFIPGSRLTAEISIEMNLNRKTFAFFNQVRAFQAKNLDFTLGDTSSRYLHATVPNINFPVPAFTLPDTGSIPVTFSGIAYETTLDAADEITLSFP